MVSVWYGWRNNAVRKEVQGVKFEPSGVGGQSGDYYRFSLGVKDSLVFRGPMLLHNYPNLLERAGYKLVGARLYAPPHVHKDFRSVMFAGRRKTGGGG